eukprot:CAMPEP_0202481844 /NCGR_PEP_ID=MMETSP1361-20130828/1327_1 /ASSEMBLY_ACC=CAM_ASM_000849 /TAXON_ID=210615 /ORGANISM="Staurosira complex sp., Strain CCMP2646" /LENGTH=127 /DNA_ID=CAMNT_0049109473 /DNA_START=17 /DNA_END=400 /DNA_ORIENTATION=+
MSQAAMKSKEEPKAKRPKLGDEEVKEEDDDDDDDEKETPSTNTTTTTLERNDDGDAYIELSPKRRCTVRQWKGKVLVDIREVYEKDGKTLPGKKGISLTLEQFQVLQAAMTDGSLSSEIKRLQSDDE